MIAEVGPPPEVPRKFRKRLNPRPDEALEAEAAPPWADDPLNRAHPALQADDHQIPELLRFRLAANHQGLDGDCD
jgi:hypothetical protein